MELRTTAFESSRCRVEDGIQLSLTRIAQGCRLTAVHRLRRQVADARIPMRGVAPSEESLAVHASVLDAAEAGREGKAGLDGFELWLRIRAVVAEVRHAVALGE